MKIDSLRIREAKEWQTLPGVGRYTAGAIASIAFDERAPILDGNVIRLLSRLFAIPVDPNTPRGRKIFWERAELILPEKGFGDFNQALMEIGATICSPKKPTCLICPLSEDCRACRSGEISRYPRKGRTIRYQKVELSAAIIRRGGKLLMIRRPDRGLLKGMWEFPMVEGGPRKMGRLFSVKPVRSLSPVRHSVLNRRLTIFPYLCEGERPVKGEVRPLKRARWFEPDEIPSLPTSSMNRKILKGFEKIINKSN